MDVHLLLDAEHSHLQPAVRLIALALMKIINVERAVISNTYQCYLKGTEGEIMGDMALMKKFGARFGCKIVRGAYMDYERKRSESLNTACPIWDSYEETNFNYDRQIVQIAS